MARAPFEADWIVGSILLTTLNNTFVIDLGGSIFTITIPPGRYWLWMDRGNSPTWSTDYPSFFKAFVEAVSQAIYSDTSNVQIAVRTPRLTRMPGTGFALTLSLNPTYTWLITHPNWTLPVGLLGMSELVPEYPDDVVVASGGPYLTPYAIEGNLTTHRRASFKLFDEEHEQYKTGRSNWRWGTTQSRTLFYRKMPSGMVRRTRAAEHPAWAKRACVALYDGNNTFQQLWRHTLSRMKPMLVVHNAAATHTLELPESDVEALILSDENQLNRFSACIGEKPVKLEGELYNLELACEIITSTYLHS